MKPIILGNFIPTPQDFIRDEILANEREARRDKIALKKLSGFKRKYEQGETRYYDGPNSYAIVSKRDDKTIKWFKHVSGEWMPDKVKAAKYN